MSPATAHGFTANRETQAANSFSTAAGDTRRGRRHRRDHVLEKLFQLGRGRDIDGYRLGDFGTYLGGGGGVGDADEVGPARRADQRLGHGFAQRTCDRAGGVLGHDDRLPDDEPLRQLHPEHDVGTVGLFAIVDEEGGREATADPLAKEPRLTRFATAIRRDAPRLQAGSLSIMTGSYRRRRPDRIGSVGWWKRRPRLGRRLGQVSPGEERPSRQPLVELDDSGRASAQAAGVHRRLRRPGSPTAPDSGMETAVAGTLPVTGGSPVPLTTLAACGPHQLMGQRVGPHLELEDRRHAVCPSFCVERGAAP